MDISFDQQPECKSPSYRGFRQCKPMVPLSARVSFSHCELNGRLKLTFVDMQQQKSYLCYFTPKLESVTHLKLREESSTCTKGRSFTYKMPGSLRMWLTCFWMPSQHRCSSLARGCQSDVVQKHFHSWKMSSLQHFYLFQMTLILNNSPQYLSTWD